MMGTMKIFSFSTTTMTKSYNQKLFKPHTKSLTRFVLVRVINDWNSLPQSVIDANSPNQFKNLLDSHYVNVMYDL